MVIYNVKKFTKQYKNIIFVYIVVYLQEELYFLNEISPIDKSFVILFKLKQY